MNMNESSGSATMVNKYPNLKLSTGSCNTDHSLIPHHLCCNHRQCLALRGIHLARHDTTSGFVFRQVQFSQTTSGSRRQVSNVIGNFHQRTGDHVQSTMGLYERVVSSQSLELDLSFLSSVSNHPDKSLALFGAVLNSSPVSLETSEANLMSNPFLVFRPCDATASENGNISYEDGTNCSNSSAALSQQTESRQNALSTFNAVRELLHVSAKLLSES